MPTDTSVDEFEAQRPVLTGVAYRMLGRVADAEDVVQEAWLRWSAADRATVREPRAFLVRITTRLAIDRLRQVQSRRETYVGPWLPEPVYTEFGEKMPDTAEQAVLADSVSLAVLVVLESLSPLERAVFVLREAFGFPFAQIAEILDRTEAAVRQLAGRARKHVGERKPRYDVDPVERRTLTEKFLAAAAAGDLDGLIGMLAPDARLVGDGGGVTRAPLRVLESADKVGRFLHGVAGQSSQELDTFRIAELNGGPAVLGLIDGKVAVTMQLDIADGLVQSVYVQRNPAKLESLTADPDGRSPEFPDT
ncbi:RNA polymerase sigma factor SigJ [Streptomyces sp. KLOTTS4A1]|uniref:RNA polymerase sigma factor SigJ n=1 Tax=Streptomyces sp. KLOTTS4A1 TaxID=3390996 RepID=UPI0039F48665